jgi:5-methylcytosine-specific restriction endonuclease McrA
LGSIIAAFCALDGARYKQARESVKKRGRNGQWDLLASLIRVYDIQLERGWSPRSGAPVTNGSELCEWISNKTAERLDKQRAWEEYQGFFKTKEWRSVRYRALQAHGARCQCCGRTASEGVIIHVDHIKPRSKYPELALDVSNLQVLCEDCNLGKSNKDETDWR